MPSRRLRCTAGASIAHDACADLLDENLVTVRPVLRVAQIRRKAPRNGPDSVAASAILGVSRLTDLDGQRIAPIRILGEPFVAERLEPLGIHRLRRDVTVSQAVLGRQQDTGEKRHRHTKSYQLRHEHPPDLSQK